MHLNSARPGNLEEECTKNAAKIGDSEEDCCLSLCKPIGVGQRVELVVMSGSGEVLFLT